MQLNSDLSYGPDMDKHFYPAKAVRSLIEQLKKKGYDCNIEGDCVVIHLKAFGKRIEHLTGDFKQIWKGM